MKIETRNELEIFKDLEELCTSPGYAHVIAYFCYRDNTIRYVGEISVEDRLQQFSGNRLIRSEISTLIGLMYKKEIILSIPEPDIFQKYIDQTESLLEEIHNAMRMTIVDMSVENNLSSDFNPLKDGSALREAIFYSDESAYDFQYLELSIRKYSKDNNWFIRNKGYSIEQAGNVISTISKLQNNKINDVFNELINKDIKEWSMLPAFIFNVFPAVAGVNGLDAVAVVLNRKVGTQQAGSHEFFSVHITPADAVVANLQFTNHFA